MWLALITFFILLPLAIAGVSMAPWVPTRKKDIERLLDIMDLQSSESFLEIGCGDGRVSLAVAKEYPQAHIKGIEIAYPMYFFALFRRYISGAKNVKIRLANAFKEDFGSYDAIYVYGMPDKMGEKIVPQFLTQAKSGAKLYSYVFSIPEEYRKSVVSHGREGESKIHVLEK